MAPHDAASPPTSPNLSALKGGEGFTPRSDPELRSRRHFREGCSDILGGAKLAHDREEDVEHGCLRGRPAVEHGHADVRDEMDWAEEQDFFRGVAARLALDGDAEGFDGDPDPIAVLEHHFAERLAAVA